VLHPQRLAAEPAGAAAPAEEAAAEAGLAGAQGTGFTGELGRIFWNPSTMT
jgi:hypothetical protein